MSRRCLGYCIACGHEQGVIAAWLRFRENTFLVQSLQRHALHFRRELVQ